MQSSLWALLKEVISVKALINALKFADAVLKLT